MSIIINREIILGGVGFAGNFGHIRYLDAKRLCSCGKQGCLQTEVSGDALQHDLSDALMRGESSLYFNAESSENYQYHEVLDAAIKGDALSIQLLQQQGDKLGQALGNIVNLLNPNLIVIGGEFVMVQDFFVDAVKFGMRKTALVDSLQNCEIRPSNLGRYLSSKAGGCMLLKNYELIEY